MLVAILAGLISTIISYIIVKTIWIFVVGAITFPVASLIIGILGDIAIVIGAIGLGIWVYRKVRRRSSPTEGSGMGPMETNNETWPEIFKMQAIGLFGALAIWATIGGAYMLYLKLAVR